MGGDSSIYWKLNVWGIAVSNAGPLSLLIEECGSPQFLIYKQQLL